MRTGTILGLSAALATGAAGAGAAMAAASETAYLSRFSGEWTASGLVRRNLDSSGNQVTCRMSGSNEANRAIIRGTCRAALVFSRRIAADLIYDPATGNYSGVYTGSTIGPARLSGVRSGDTLRLTVFWPRTSSGERRSTMVIHNPSGDRFTFTVIEDPPPGGRAETMTDLTFRPT